MTLREKLLAELRQQNEAIQAQIKELDKSIDADYFAMSTITDGLFAGMARSSCRNSIQVASLKKSRLQQQNTWVSEMLSKYH